MQELSQKSHPYKLKLPIDKKNATSTWNTMRGIYYVLL